MKNHMLVLWVAILASAIAFLDGSVVNVALPAISKEFGGSFAVQQWVVDAYLLTLGAFMLTAGSLSDLFGRKKILIIGLAGFGIASLFCALAPNSQILIFSRGVQGAAGALLVPSSLALIMTGFEEKDRPKAIGSWTAWTSVAFIIGPLLGGVLVDTVSWRLVFAINLIPVACTLWLANKLKIAEKLDKNAKLDVPGAVLCAIGLGGTVYALIEQSRFGWSDPLIYVSLIIGIVGLVAFIWYENRIEQPMLPLGLFTIRNFSFGNIATLMIYASLSLATFLITIFVQQVGGYTATAAGLSLIPVTVVMTLLSSKFGELSGRYGSRWFMTFGPLISGVGIFSMLLVNDKVKYFALFPGILLLGLGLSITVAPLTSAVLGSIDKNQSGIASAVNNAVARIAGLVAIAAIGTVIGTSLGLRGFYRSMVVTSGLMFAGGIVSAIGIRNYPKNKVIQ